MTKKHPSYLFSRKSDHWAQVKQQLISASGAALFLDYDGTLTQIQPTPDAAILSPEAEEYLRQLSQLQNIKLNIVTGRSLDDIRKLVPLENVGFAANHGFHIFQNGKEWIHPHALRFIPILTRLQAILRNSLKAFPKALIENKQFTLSIHYRKITASHVPLFKSLVTKTVGNFDSSLIITRGKKVLEVRPPIAWGKGHAAQTMLKAFHVSHNLIPVFLGDDTTDEDVFRVLRPSGVTICVGKKLTTHAEYFVQNVDEVLPFLKSLIAIYSHRPSRH